MKRLSYTEVASELYTLREAKKLEKAFEKSGEELTFVDDIDEDDADSVESVQFKARPKSQDPEDYGISTKSLENMVLEFFKRNSSLEDVEIHNFAESVGVPYEIVEKVIYKMFRKHLLESDKI